ncbi:MAG: HlyD family efflux transporter periplasmic adaptor subunit [Bacteroidetes bacterium]|nr:HlyD family efflux transporter periplasmic adaptor subunit [Bacteroidota bacterium]MBL6963936.1 HlyD family efflux transporter periplasmic adaptor subunit [Bacteroidota bacterium]
MKEKKLEIRSEEVQDLMGQIPSWLVRIGTSIILVVLLILMTGSWFFKYPDIIVSPVKLTTQLPPAEVIARSNGKIEAIFTDDKQNVQKDDILAIIQNPANYYDVIALELKLDSLKPFLKDFKVDSYLLFNEDYTLGELQSFYSNFLKLYNDYQHFVDLNYHKQKIQSLNDQITRYNSYYGQLYRQKKVLEEELAIAIKQKDRNKVLLEKDILSMSTYEKSESNVLEKKFAVEKANTELSNNRLKTKEIEQQILDIRLTSKDDKSELQLELLEASEILKSSISQWMQKYVLLAPMDGIISMTSFWSENQNVRDGEAVFAIIPQKSSEVIAKCTLPAKGSGKVKEGQKVNIKFDNYPFMEYGIVSGVVQSISLVPSDHNFIVQVSLTSGLQTNYQKELQFSQEMTGIAEIITEEIRLFNRLFNPLKSFMYERLSKNS